MIRIALGTALFATPWAFNFVDHLAAAWTAWLTGIAIGTVGLIDYAEDAPWAAWTNMGLGMWTVLGPCVVPFATLEPAAWAHFVIGAALTAISIRQLLDDGRRRLTA
jgi:hypothetical protein